MNRIQAYVARVKQLRWDPTPREVIDVVLGSILAMFGLMLLLPADTFSIASPYRYMSALPEWAWGAVTFGTGTYYLHLLRRRARRNHILYLILALYTSIAIALVSAAPWTTASAVYVLLARFSWWALDLPDG